MQAVYHGKPVLAMPFFGDQPNNADKMVSKVGQATLQFRRTADGRFFCILEFVRLNAYVPRGTLGFSGTAAMFCLTFSTAQHSQCRPVLTCTQGMAEKVSPSQIGSPGFSQALMKVLTEDSYSQAARALSRKIRAHKRTPVQQAGGMGTSHSSCICVIWAV